MKTSNEKRKGIVYSSRCVITDKRYIGQMGERHGKRAPRTPEKMLAVRRSEHESHAHSADHRRKKCRRFYPALRKYGVENFHWEILADTTSQSELNALENHYIRHFNTRHPHGYNLTDGGEGGAHHPETRKKIGAKSRGRKHSEETRKKIGAKSRGRKHSEETRAKISEAGRGRKMPPEAVEKTAAWHRGKKRSPETCARIGAVRRGKKDSAETREKKAARQRGKKMSPEAVEKTAAWHRGKKRPPEARANMTAAQNRPEVRNKRLAAWTDEKRAKKSEAMRGKNNPMFGETHSTETREQMSAGWTDERRAKQSEAMSGENNPSKRPEVRAKISAAAKKRGAKKREAKRNGVISAPLI